MALTVIVAMSLWMAGLTAAPPALAAPLALAAPSEPAPSPSLAAPQDLAAAQDGAATSEPSSGQRPASGVATPESPADPDVLMVITLTSGDVLRVRIIERDHDRLVVEHAVLGRLAIPLSAISSLAPAGEPGPAPEAAAPATTVPPATIGAAAPPLPTSDAEQTELQRQRRKLWSSQLELGASATAGNKQDTDFRLSLLATRTAEVNVLKLDSTYRHSSSRGDRRVNDFTAGVFSEWPVRGGRWTLFAQGRFDYDEFVSWDYRLTAAGGVGYRLIEVRRRDDHGQDTELLQLKLRGGAGVRREFGSENEQLNPEGLAGAVLLWRPMPRQTVAAESTFYPSLLDRGEFRIVSAASWVFDLDAFDGISIKVGLSHEYDSQTDPGIERHDLAVFSALVIRF